MIEENGVTRTKKYEKLFATEKIQADCDLKATNIILQRLPSDVYSLINHHSVANDLWERFQLLMQVEHGPLIWLMIEENGVTRTKKYEKLSATEKIQADCDLKATNIILQRLPSDVYSLINHHKVANDLWERVQLLMQVLVAAAPRAVDLADSPVSTLIDQDAPSTSIPLTQDQEHSPIISQ
nr:hypothetical protein [Tanacetum cinerariifolium]